MRIDFAVRGQLQNAVEIVFEQIVIVEELRAIINQLLA